MAKKTVFQDIDPGTVSSFEFIDSILVGIPMANSVETVLLSEQMSKRDQVLQLLETQTQSDLKNINKIFVLPGCTMPMDRLKSYLKEHKITITNDYTQADAIVTHNHLEAEVESYGANITSNYLMWEMGNGYFMDDVTLEVGNYCSDNDRHCVATKHALGTKSFYNQEYSSMPYNSYLISGLALEIANKLKNGEIRSVSTETVARASATQQVLTEQLKNDLIGMYKGGTEEREMFYKLCPTIIADKNIHFLYELVQEMRYSDPRDKDFRYWKEQNNIAERFEHRTINEIIKYEHRDGNLTSESFKYFEPLCRREIEIRNRDIYTFKVQVLPEYREYLK